MLGWVGKLGKLVRYVGSQGFMDWCCVGKADGIVGARLLLSQAVVKTPRPFHPSPAVESKRSLSGRYLTDAIGVCKAIYSLVSLHSHQARNYHAIYSRLSVQQPLAAYLIPCEQCFGNARLVPLCLCWLLGASVPALVLGRMVSLAITPSATLPQLSVRGIYYV